MSNESDFQRTERHKRRLRIEVRDNYAKARDYHSRATQHIQIARQKQAELLALDPNAVPPHPLLNPIPVINQQGNAPTVEQANAIIAAPTSTFDNEGNQDVEVPQEAPKVPPSPAGDEPKPYRGRKTYGDA